LPGVSAILFVFLSLLLFFFFPCIAYLLEEEELEADP